jgi:hypothetical protein
MKDLLNIGLLIVLGVLYLMSFTKIQASYFNKLSTTRTNAISILYISSILAAGLVLFDISKTMTDAYNFFYEQNNLGAAFLYLGLYFVGAWGFSIGLFHASFFLVSKLTKEDEKAALAANNVEIALVHAAVLLMLSLMIAPALSSFASSFIPYPELPF